MEQIMTFLCITPVRVKVVGVEEVVALAVMVRGAVTDMVVEVLVAAMGNVVVGVVGVGMMEVGRVGLVVGEEG